MPDETFYEDSSTALGLGHGTRLGIGRVDLEHESKLSEAGIKTASDEQRVDPVNAGSADRIAELVTMGYGTAEAIEIALAEADGEEGVKERHDYMGDRTENLMQAAVTPTGSSSNNGRKRGRKIKPIMTAIDRAMVGTVEDEIPRNSLVGAKVTAMTKVALDQRLFGLTAGQIVESIVGTAISCQLNARQVGSILERIIENMEAEQNGAA